ESVEIETDPLPFDWAQVTAYHACPVGALATGTLLTKELPHAASVGEPGARYRASRRVQRADGRRGGSVFAAFVCRRRARTLRRNRAGCVPGRVHRQQWARSTGSPCVESASEGRRYQALRPAAAGPEGFGNDESAFRLRDIRFHCGSDHGRVSGLTLFQGQ